MILRFYSKTAKGGFLVLTTILLVCATILIIITGILLRSISEINETTDSEKSLIALSTVSACGEYTLQQLASSTDSVGWSYSGDYSLSVGAQTCYIYGIEDGVGGVKLVKASSTVSGFTKKILIEVATNTPRVVVNFWKEVADF